MTSSRFDQDAMKVDLYEPVASSRAESQKCQSHSRRNNSNDLHIYYRKVFVALILGLGHSKVSDNICNLKDMVSIHKSMLS